MQELKTGDLSEKSGLLLEVTEQRVQTRSKIPGVAGLWPWDDGWDGGADWDGGVDFDGWDGDGFDGWDGDV